DPTGQSFVVRYGAGLGDVVFGHVRDLVAEPDREAADVASAPTGPSIPALTAEAPLRGTAAGLSTAPLRGTATGVSTAPLRESIAAPLGDISPPDAPEGNSLDDISALAAPEFHRGHVPLGDISALVPRVAPPDIEPARALALVDRYGELIASLVGRAIAVDWD